MAGAGYLLGRGLTPMDDRMPKLLGRYVGPRHLMRSQSSLIRRGFRPPRRVPAKSSYSPSRLLGTERELKFHDVVQSATLSVTGSIIAPTLTVIAQGTGESERIGRRIWIRSIDWRYELSKSTTTIPSNTAAVGRVMLVLDRQANGAAPAVTDVLETATLKSFNNLSNKHRFRTIFDEFITVNQQCGAYSGVSEQFGAAIAHLGLHRNLNVAIDFSGVGGLIAEITSNNLFIMAISDTTTLVLDYVIRLRYTD